jgi:hypothetical protein
MGGPAEAVGSTPNGRRNRHYLLHTQQPDPRLRVDHSWTKKKQRCWSTLLVVAALPMKLMGIAGRRKG